MATPTSAMGYQNFFSATLSGDITASSTDILLDNIPNSNQGYLVIEPDSPTNREVIFYTSKTALKVVCTSAADGRGQDDTSAKAHLQGSAVIMAPVAGHLESLQSGASLTDGAITPEKLVSGAGTSWNWQTWVPVFTNFTKGSATIDAKYCQIGKMVHFSLNITLSGSTMGSGITFTLPVTAATRTTNFPLSGQVVFLDSGTGSYNGYALWSTASVSTLLTWDGNNNSQTLTASSPFVWANNDQISVNGFYEAA